MTSRPTGGVNSRASLGLQGIELSAVSEAKGGYAEAFARDGRQKAFALESQQRLADGCLTDSEFSSPRCFVDAVAGCDLSPRDFEKNPGSDDRAQRLSGNLHLVPPILAV